MSDHLSCVPATGSVHVSGSGVWFVYTIDNNCPPHVLPVTHSSLQHNLTCLTHIGSWSSGLQPQVPDLRLQTISVVDCRGWADLYKSVLVFLPLCSRRDSTLSIWQWIEENSETLEIRTNYWAPASAFLPFKIPEISPSSRFTIYSDEVVQALSKADGRLVKTRLIVGTAV